jgi:transcriptional regulator with XRE-family HTH domain
MAAVPPDPTVQRRRLRMELRKARDSAGLKQADVAAAMEWSPSKLMRIESGQVSISTNDLKALLAYYGMKDKVQVNRLVELARTTRGASFYDQYADVLKQGFKEYLAYEAFASVVRQYDPVLVPGLLQTEEYARAILEQAAGFGPEVVDKAWAVRQHRQELHDRDTPPDMLFVVDEAALRRHVGKGQIMRHQLERLLEYAEQPHVSLQVLPFSRGAHPGMLGNFILLEFADPNLDDLVHLESINEITVRDDTALIARYLDKFLQLEERALSPEESTVMLKKLIEEMSANSARGAEKAAS